MPTQQSTDSLIKSLSKHKSAEEKAAAIKKLTPQQKLKIRMQRALNKQVLIATFSSYCYDVLFFQWYINNRCFYPAAFRLTSDQC